jgi:hypothetical protein
MVDDDAARQLELADEALQAFDANAAAAHLSAAIRTFTAAGDCRQAALVCARLGDLYAHGLDNITAARAWFLRGTRLVENEPPCIEQGWRWRRWVATWTTLRICWPGLSSPLTGRGSSAT